MALLKLLRDPLAAVPRQLGLALFRMHIETGAFVSFGMGTVGLAFALVFGRIDAIMAASGALCASIVDQPGPVPVKARMFTLSVAASTLIAYLIMVSNDHPLVTGVIIVGMSFVSGLVSTYGKRAIGLGVAAVLALLFGMAANQAALMPVESYIAFFASGGVAYTVFALATSVALDRRHRRMHLGEAVHAFSAYLAAKAELYDPKTRTRLAMGNLVEAHAAFTEKLQAARDFIFIGPKTASRRHWMAALLALLDCFDMVVSSDADIETMRNSGYADLLHRLKTLTSAVADDTEALALALTTPGVNFVFNNHAEEIAALSAEVEQMAASAWGRETLANSAFRSAGHKLAMGISRLERLAQAVDASADAATILPHVELEAFVHRDRMDPRVLLNQFSLDSPVMRYAIRLTLARVNR